MRGRWWRGARVRAALVAVVAATFRGSPVVAQSTALPSMESLRPVRDSFAAVAPTGVVGTMQWSLSRSAAGGWRVSEWISVDDVLDLTTLSRTSSTGRLEQFTQTGVAFSRDVLADLRASEGRWRGQVLGADATRLASIDLATSESRDLTLLPALLAAVSWRDGATASWPMAQPSTGVEVVVALVCEGSDSVSVRGTVQPAWRVKATIGGQVTRYWLGLSTPSRVLAVATDGLPFRFIAR